MEIELVDDEMGKSEAEYIREFCNTYFESPFGFAASPCYTETFLSCCTTSWLKALCKSASLSV